MILTHLSIPPSSICTDSSPPSTSNRVRGCRVAHLNEIHDFQHIKRKKKSQDLQVGVENLQLWKPMDADDSLVLGCLCGFKKLLRRRRQVLHQLSDHALLLFGPG